MGKNITITILSIIVIFLCIKLHWCTNDINWLATLIGAFATGLITWFAIYKTSELDRNEHMYELKYKHYVSTLSFLEELLPQIIFAVGKFKPELNVTFDENTSNEYPLAQKFKQVYDHLCTINKNFKKETNFIKSDIDEFLRINNLVLGKVFETDYEMTDRKYTIQQILDFAKSKDISFDAKTFENNLKKLKDLIVTEYSMDK